MERGITQGCRLPSCPASPPSFSASILGEKAAPLQLQGSFAALDLQASCAQQPWGVSGCESLLPTSCRATPRERWQGDAVSISPEGSASPGRVLCLPEQCCACLARRHGIGACSGGNGWGRVWTKCRQDAPSTRMQGIAHLGVTSPVP